MNSYENEYEGKFVMTGGPVADCLISKLGQMAVAGGPAQLAEQWQ